jgi:hypothetical protein
MSKWAPTPPSLSHHHHQPPKPIIISDVRERKRERNKIQLKNG